MADQETRHFDGTVEKVTKDGERVASSYLDPGEKLASEVDAENAESESKGSDESDSSTTTPKKTASSKH